MEKEKALVILVNYNNEVEIRDFLTAFRGEWPISDCVFVDDGSTDASPRIAQDLGFHVLFHGENRGVGAALRTGLEYAVRRSGYTVVVTMSCNGKMQPSDIKRVVGPVLSGEADYAQGSRFAPGGRAIGLPLSRNILIRIFSVLASVILRKRFTDITCTFRAYRLDFLRDPRIRLNQRWLERYEMDYYVHYWACRLRLRIKEVPVTIDYVHLKPGRLTKIVPFSGWWSILRTFVFLPLRIKR